ncbi:MAG: peptidoglycan-binding domain-containing protein [Bacteroidota bacterium]
MLSLGDSGPEVCLLQEWINGLSPNCVPVNGRFDERTEAALFDIIGAPSASLQEISHPDNPC